MPTIRAVVVGGDADVAVTTGANRRKTVLQFVLCRLLLTLVSSSQSPHSSVHCTDDVVECSNVCGVLCRKVMIRFSLPSLHHTITTSMLPPESTDTLKPRVQGRFNPSCWVGETLAGCLGYTYCTWILTVRSSQRFFRTYFFGSHTT